MAVPDEGSDEVRAVLPALFRTGVGKTATDGTVAVRQNEPHSAFLYGPYWNLKRGVWCIDFTCSVTKTTHPDDVFLGVEVVLQNRFLLAVTDFTARDLADGKGSLWFEIGGSLAPDLGNDAMVEFRFQHYRAATFTIGSVTLHQSAGTGSTPSVASRWRLTSRLARRGRGRWMTSRAGLWPGLPGRKLAYSVEPRLTLPAGRYRLTLNAVADWLSRLTASSLGLEIKAGATTLEKKSFATDDLQAGRLSVEFAMPPDPSQDQGTQDPLKIEFTLSGPGGLTVGTVELERLASTAATVEAPAIVGTAPIRVVLIGNCQTEVMTSGIWASPAAGRVRATYHPAGMSRSLVDTARSQLAGADVLLVQDVRDFDRYPLKDELPQRVPVHRFPLLLFATPWPYDSMSGLPDRHAQQAEQIRQRFVNLDGALGRLRRQVPDPEVRFRAYKELAFDWPVDLGRLASFEERRLQAMDRKYGIAIGADILTDLRTHHDFHTMDHAGARMLGRLLDHLCGVAGLGRIEAPRRVLDSLRNIQVPVHPEIARRLGLKWADESTVYEFRGMPRTWEAWAREYIAHFG